MATAPQATPQAATGRPVRAWTVAAKAPSHSSAQSLPPPKPQNGLGAGAGAQQLAPQEEPPEAGESAEGGEQEVGSIVAFRHGCPTARRRPRASGSRSAP